MYNQQTTKEDLDKRNKPVYVDNPSKSNKNLDPEEDSELKTAIKSLSSEYSSNIENPYNFQPDGDDAKDPYSKYYDYGGRKSRKIRKRKGKTQNKRSKKRKTIRRR